MKHTFSASPEGIAIRFEGAFKEGLQLTLNEIAGRLPTAKRATIHFDMAGVSNVNSIGIREWLTFVRSIELKHELIFRECPDSFMGFALMVPGVIGKGRVESFVCHYRCRTCRVTSQARRLGADVRRDGLGTAACGNCGNEMESQISDGDDLQAMLREPVA